MKDSKKYILWIIFILLTFFLIFPECKTLVISGYEDKDNDRNRDREKDRDRDRPHQREIRVGDVITVTGRVGREGNHYSISDVNSSNTFVLLGLGGNEKNTLYKNEGDVVKIRLKIVSVESRNSYSANCIEIY
jgi:hypothetical protein